MKTEKELPGIKLVPSEFQKIEKVIIAAFVKNVFAPMLRTLDIDYKRIVNASNSLRIAIQKGRVYYSEGAFRGKFNARISKELEEIGAVWDKSIFKIKEADIPHDIKSSISISKAKFTEKISEINDLLSSNLDEKISKSVNVTNLFDKVIWKFNREFEKSVRGITVPPELTSSQSRRIAEEWQGNMDLWVKDFTEEMIVDLRKRVSGNVFAGNRYEDLIKTLKKSYNITTRKAKFLARQETNLLLSKFKETRYTDLGIDKYRWQCVVGTVNHPVRPSHEALNGKIFRWDDPPVTTMPGEPQRRNNPGQDFNCRCVARPILKF